MVILIAGGIALLIRRKYNLDWLKTFGYFLLGIYGLNLIQSFLSGINSFLYYSNALFLFSIVIVFAIFQYLKNGGEGKYIEEWENANFPLLSSFQFSTILYSNCDVTKVRYYDDIPYNRPKDSLAYIHAYFLELVEDAFMARELPDDEEIMEVAQMHYARLAAV